MNTWCRLKQLFTFIYLSLGQHLTVIEYMCHQWPEICSTCRKHFRSFTDSWLITGFVTTETCQKYSVTVILHYIFHIKPQFFKALFQSQFLFDFDESLTNRSENVRSFLWLFYNIFGSTYFKYSWFKHKLKLFVFKCTIIVLYFWRSKFSFVFKSWTHKNYRL